jgi:hypothetical protein
MEGDDAGMWFNSEWPGGRYRLDVGEPYERAILVEILYLAAYREGTCAPCSCSRACHYHDTVLCSDCNKNSYWLGTGEPYERAILVEIIYIAGRI